MRHYPRKRFGQHFLIDQGVLAQIVAALDLKPKDFVIEIGPGLGALTAPLLQELDALHAVELDRDLVASLPRRLGQPVNLVLHQADALAFDFAGLQVSEGQGRPCKIVGNLPYNISTPLLLRLLSLPLNSDSWVFMLQAEVAERLVAQPGGKDYGRLTVMVQYEAEVNWLFEVSPTAFNPPPQVMSAVVRLTPRREKSRLAQDKTQFAALVQAAFMKRRKTLANALKNRVSAEDFEALGIDSSLRPEQLSVDDFVRLSNRIARALK